MNDPSPLLDEDLPEDVARLLRAADEDVHPNADAQGALLVSRFGKGAAAVSAPSLTMKLVQRFGSLRRVATYTGLIAVVAGMVSLGWRTTETEPPTRMSHAAPRVAPAPITLPSTGTPSVTPSSTIGAATALPSIDVAALPTSVGEPRRASPSSRKTERPAASLDQELARIDRARGLLGSGRPSEVLAEVTAYRREYPAAAFADEADSLEVRALAALGRATEARVLAERFLTRRPDSPYAEPVRLATGIRR